MADGSSGCLLTRHEDVRAVLGDYQRFTSRGELRNSALDGQVTAARPAKPGEINSVDPPEHTRLRRKLSGKFTTSRMTQLTERITTIVDDVLDAMDRLAPPVDLVQEFAQPIPSLVICELMGVDYAERDVFQEKTTNMLALSATPDQYLAALAAPTEVRPAHPGLRRPTNHRRHGRERYRPPPQAIRRPQDLPPSTPHDPNPQTAPTGRMTVNSSFTPPMRASPQVENLRMRSERCVCGWRSSTRHEQDQASCVTLPTCEDSTIQH